MRMSEPAIDPVDHGYRVGYALAEENLSLGHAVIADCVNPLTSTRKAWRDVAIRSGANYIEVEVTCTDQAEHRRRVETRVTDIEGLKLPTWQAVSEREYDPWDPHLVIDTSHFSVEQSVAAIRAAVERR